MTEPQKYVIKLLAHPKHPDIPEGYYGPVRGVTMNHAIYSRVSRKHAFELNRCEAIAFMQSLKGWPAVCEPPITITY
jgi:hypothetical protein